MSSAKAWCLEHDAVTRLVPHEAVRFTQMVLRPSAGRVAVDAVHCVSSSLRHVPLREREVFGSPLPLRRDVDDLSSNEGHLVDALAPRGDEGRGTLRKASGSCEQALIRGCPNGETPPF